MSHTVVVSQSMYFPWVGLLEQVRLADVFVHYDDVQFARGFFNRVQVKTPNGPAWMTVPLRDWQRGQAIDRILIDESVDWRMKHRKMLQHAYQKAPFRDDMLSLIDSVFAREVTNLAELARHSVYALANYFDLPAPAFMQSRDMGVDGSSSARLRDIVLALHGDVYVTGHGARNYLDHELFERDGIAVRYMNYRCSAYPQLHGEFTPYVTALDLVANCGRAGAAMICSETVDWKEFTA